MLRYCVFTLTIIALFATSSCLRDANYRSGEGMVWNTEWHACWKGDESIRDSIINEFEIIGKTLSVFDPESLVTKVNRRDSCSVNQIFEEVYLCARHVNSKTQGAFDPTLSPLIQAWGFGIGHTLSADTLKIDSIRNFTGIEKTRLIRHTLHKDHPKVSFNFSAIAKGYACDRIAEMMRRKGIKDFLIEIGGEIRCGGLSPQNREWVISIDRPVVEKDISHASQAIIQLTDMGLATSGNYRNRHTSGQNTFGHIINPRTGRPAVTDIASATVILPTAIQADAFATAFIVLGSKVSEEIALEEKMAVMLILNDSTIWESPEFKKYRK